MIFVILVMTQTVVPIQIRDELVMNTQRCDRECFIVLLLISILCITAFSSIKASPMGQSSQDVVAAFVSAYNDHDVDQMMTLCTDDVRWLSVDGHSIETVVAGRQNLDSEMRDHFRRNPRAKSELIVVGDDGPMVVAIEAASSEMGNATDSQCSASVYRLRAGLIESIWYFEAYTCGMIDDGGSGQ